MTKENGSGNRDRCPWSAVIALSVYQYTQSKRDSETEGLILHFMTNENVLEKGIDVPGQHW
jgi:hypothetical protein